MKKVFFTCALCAMALSVSAYDEIQVKPATIPANKLTDVQVYLNSSTYNECMKYLEFDLILPTGWTFGSSAAENLERTGEWDDDEEDYVSNMSIDYTRSNNTLHFMMWANDPDYPLHGSEGVLATIKIKAPAGTADGIYPLVIKGGAYMCKSSVDAENVVWTEDQISYVKIGTPTDATLVATGVIPTFVNEALATETAVKTLDLSAVTAVNGDFTYVAGRKVVAPATDVNASVKFDAPLAGTYSSFCAPVDVNVDCFTYSSCDGTTAVFEPATTAPANTPVLINKAVKTAAQADVLKTVEGRQITKGYYVANDGSGMRSVNSTATIPALRGAWEDIVASSNLRIAIETATGIEYIGTAEEVFGNTYDLQGRQVENAHNGVFVVNGKKQFVK